MNVNKNEKTNYYNIILQILLSNLNINISSTSNSKEECDCINNSTIAGHANIQRKLDAGLINKADAEFLRNWLIRIQDETSVFEKRYESAKINIYKQKCIHLCNFIEKTYPEPQ